VIHLVLASTSPQRRSILAQLGVSFEAVAPGYVEEALPLPPAALVERHATGKATAVAAVHAGRPVLGVDTAVVDPDGHVLGKPVDAADAARMLRSLAGHRHRVVSGLTLVSALRTFTGHATTEVWFRELSHAAVERYVACGEWRGRAGGYAIQGVGSALVERIAGCYPNVVGLPVALLVDALASVGLPLLPAGDRSGSA
jgi:septum formation protein